MRCLPSSAGVLTKVWSTARITGGDVVATETTCLVIRSDLGGGTVWVLAGKIADRAGEHAVLLSELAKVEIPSELICQERILLDQVGRSALEIRIYCVDRSNAFALDRFSRTVHRSSPKSHQVRSLGIL